jgi:hypothetical protein
MKPSINTGRDFESLMTALGITPKMRNGVKKVNNKVIQNHSLDQAQPDPHRICADGERTEHLTRLAGRFIGEGDDIRDVKLKLLEWNACNTPPLDHHNVIATCESILHTHQRNHPGLPRSTELLPLFDISEAKVHSMINTQPPQRRWLLKNCLPYGKVGMIVAPGGTGKSMFVLQMAVALATGEKFINLWDIGEVGSSLILFGEEDVDEIHTRLHNIAAPHGNDPQQSSDIIKRVHLKSVVDMDNLMTRSNKDVGVLVTEYVERLILTANQIPDLKLIVIDPASRFRGGNENAAEDTTRFVEALERLRKGTGATVLVLHHANKMSSTAGEANQNSSRGSSAMTDGVRWQMNLARPSTADAKKYRIDEGIKHNYLIASVTKNNYGPPQPEVLLLRGENGILYAATEHLSRLDSSQVLINILTSETTAGRRYSASAFEKKFGGLDGEFKMGENALRKVISGAISQKLIQKTKGQSGYLELVTSKRTKSDSLTHRTRLPIRK